MRLRMDTTHADCTTGASGGQPWCHGRCRRIQGTGHHMHTLETYLVAKYMLSEPGDMKMAEDTSSRGIDANVEATYTRVRIGRKAKQYWHRSECNDC